MGARETVASLATLCSPGSTNMNVVTMSDGVTECRRCNQDKHIPKLYSAANNMNPGTVPIQLQVNHLSNYCIQLQ